MRLSQISRYLKPGARQDKPVTKKRNHLIEQIEAQQNRSFEQGFLHIPKTGGSGIDDMLTALAANDISCPVKFGHGWRLRKVIRLYPEISLSFVLRDPLERMVSGFMSRLRMGRPRNNSTWSVNEAAAFAFFDNPTDMMLALLGEDERLKSAALFACQGIQHLKFNYEFYFSSVDDLRKYSASIAVVGHIDRMDAFVERFAEHAGLGRDRCLRHYKPAHVSQRQPAERFDEGQRRQLREVFSREYEIYDYLLTLVDK